MDRVVEPELSDGLPAADPRMLRVRRDLRRVNTLMGNPGIIARELLCLPDSARPRRLWELGCGDGLLLLDVARRLPRAWGPVEATLVDQKNSVRAETMTAFQTLGWSIRFEAADIFAWLRRQPPEAKADVITANMFLHHFPDDRLSELLHLAAAHTGTFIACEPRRFRRAVVSCHLLWLLGCSKITRHDALASVRAGFCGDELSRLWPQSGEWRSRESLANFGSHLFVATR
jgi:hypothetical protein